MAKIVFSADIHFCKRESLVENRYQHLIDSIRWVDSLQGDLFVDLGDMFNTSSLTAEDVSVLEQIKFNNSWHCIMGNHEQDGTNSLLKYFRDIHTIYEKPQLRNFGSPFGWILFIPYSKNPVPLNTLLAKLPDGERVLVASHCDIIGMFGAEVGYSTEEINGDGRIKFWFQGHYHTRAILSSKIAVVGNLLGKNFTQNFDKHGVAVYDTTTNTFEFIENPHALRFGKMDTSDPKCRDIRSLVESDPIKRYVLAIQTDAELKDLMREWADKYLVASRVVTATGMSDLGSAPDADLDDQPLEIDHIALFFKEVGERFGEEIVNAIRAPGSN